MDNHNEKLNLNKLITRIKSIALKQFLATYIKFIHIIGRLKFRIGSKFNNVHVSIAYV